MRCSCGRQFGDAYPVRCACGLVYESAADPPAVQQRPPSIAARVNRWARAVSRWHGSGGPTRTADEVEQLLEVCRGCDLYAGDERGGLCTGCGCRLSTGTTAWSNKLAMATEACPRGHWGPRWIRHEDLTAIVRRMIPQVPPDVDAIVAIPRSGLLVGAPLATSLHLPLWTMAGSDLRPTGHGHRLARADEPLRPLLVDDTVASGRQLRRAHKRLQRRLPAAAIATAAALVPPQQAGRVDVIGQVEQLPHYLEWNFATSLYARRAGWDLDGVICENPTVPDSSPGWHGWMAAAPPLMLPRGGRVPLIATARLESWREPTEAWLRRYGVEHELLVMWPGSRADRTPEAVARFKAAAATAAGVDQFVESELPLARLIAAQAPGLRVICPPAAEVIG